MGDKREDFIKNVKCNVKPIQKKIPEPNSSKKIVVVQEKKKYKSKSSVKTKKANKRAPKIIKKAITLGVVAAVAIGVNSLYQEIQDSKNTISLSQALENGKTLEDLGLNEQVQKNLYELESQAARENLTKEENEQLALEILRLEFYIAKSKIANAINKSEETAKVNYNDIELKIYDREKSVKVIVDNVGEYEKGSWFGKTISPEIAEYIDEIVKMQEIEKRVLKGNLDVDELYGDKLKASYMEALKTTSKFAAGELKVDSRGNLVIEYKRVSEYKKEKVQEAEKNEKRNNGFEIGE